MFAFQNNITKKMAPKQKFSLETQLFRVYDNVIV